MSANQDMRELARRSLNVRQARARLRAQIKGGQGASVADLLTARTLPSHCRHITLEKVLRWEPWIGHTRAQQLIREARTSPNTPIDRVPDRARRELAARLRERKLAVREEARHDA